MYKYISEPIRTQSNYNPDGEKIIEQMLLSLKREMMNFDNSLNENSFTIEYSKDGEVWMTESYLESYPKADKVIVFWDIRLTVFSDKKSNQIIDGWNLLNEVQKEV